MNIHPSAIISKSADIHPTAKVGPFTVIGDNVKIHENTFQVVLKKEVQVLKFLSL